MPSRATLCTLNARRARIAASCERPSRPASAPWRCAHASAAHGRLCARRAHASVAHRRFRAHG
eukprot:264550-Prymnesium_polylepis.1